MHLPAWVQWCLDMLNNPLVKMAMVFIGTALLRAWPKFLNEAVPFWTGLYSVITALLGAMFPGSDAGPASTAANVMLVGFVAAASAPWWQGLLHTILVDALIPWALGFGGQRGAAQTHAFVTGKPAGVDPLVRPQTRKPLQTFLKT